MRRVASALEVQPGALYHHVPDKQTLLAAVADRILAGVDEPLGRWRPAVEAWAASLREVLLAHRDSAETRRDRAWFPAESARHHAPPGDAARRGGPAARGGTRGGVRSAVFRARTLCRGAGTAGLGAFPPARPGDGRRRRLRAGRRPSPSTASPRGPAIWNNYWLMRIIMRMTYVSRSPGARGTRGARFSACSWRRDVEIGALTAKSSAGTRLGTHQPHLTPLADRVVQDTTAENLAGHDVVFLALPHGASAEIAAQLGDDVLVIDCGADFRLDDAGRLGAVLRHAARRHLALRPARAARASARCSRGARRIAVPGCYPTASRSPWRRPSPPAWSSRDVVVVAASGTSGAGKALKPHLLGCRGDGLGVSAYGVGGVHRHTPEMVQNFSRPGRGTPDGARSRPCWCRCRAASSRPCTAPLAEPVTTAEVRAAYETAYADEPFVHLLPEGPLAADRSRCSARTRVPRAGRRRRAPPAGSSPSPRSTTSPRAPPAPPSSRMNLALACPRPSACTTMRSRTVSVTAAQGFRAAGVAAGLKSHRTPRTSRSSSTTARVRRRRRLHLEPSSRPHPVAVVAAGASPTACCARSSSTPAAPTPAPGRTGFRPRTRPPSAAADALGIGRRSTWPSARPA